MSFPLDDFAWFYDSISNIFPGAEAVITVEEETCFAPAIHV